MAQPCPMVGVWSRSEQQALTSIPNESHFRQSSVRREKGHTHITEQPRSSITSTTTSSTEDTCYWLRMAVSLQQTESLCFSLQTANFGPTITHTFFRANLRFPLHSFISHCKMWTSPVM